MKVFADKNLKVAKIMPSLNDGVENNVGKEKNTGYKHFILFQRFQKAFSTGSLKVWIVWQRVKTFRQQHHE